MNSEKASAQSRRTFLKKSSLMAAAGAAAPWALQLAAMGEAAAFSGDDYKALVCVFLYGGNDYANTVVTYDEASHRRYADIRAAGAGSAAGGIVLSRAALANTVLKPAQALPEGRQYALHPSMPNLAGLFNSGQAGVQLNVGPLVVPLTRQQFESQAYPMPPKLFSHNDQQSLWQSSSPEGSTIGWGGRLGDIAMPSNSQSLFTCISVTGNSVFLSGQDALQYQCSTSGAIKVRALQNNDWFFGNHAEMRATLLNMIQQNRSHVLQNEYNNVMRRALAAEGKVSSALSSVNLGTAFADNNLSRQMRMVARLIGARQRLGVKRQVFMVSLGGFDLHDNLVARQPGLLQEVDQAISTFYKATVELGVSDKVTTFTASDFGRTLTSNGNGSDHGWGSHHFLVGGAVKGARFYGEAPPVSASDSKDPQDQWHVGQGRLLPRTSTDQFAATLGRWFGVEEGELAQILPNLRNFGKSAGRLDYPTDLGFL
ncbi:DUF1501 domain-containing protein [Limnohabitans sp. 2KL-51]|jgi:uncharacterized protein (DUF1501 family)|uniref:DUF1501 domain-containing protein n=1 Tax=Limnohabitans sp. 2KL-51 TaxID=1977911 RepID=UPI000D3D77A8|nr:DUF1501 domain-containing protein [Limnohabitans sp. 2KL-51]PUE51746.1 Tat pathway signal protein [Limnohabitans sp. 2KL-51]